MTERIAYNEYTKLKYNTIITMKIFSSVQDSTSGALGGSQNSSPTPYWHGTAMLNNSDSTNHVTL